MEELQPPAVYFTKIAQFIVPYIFVARAIRFDARSRWKILSKEYAIRKAMNYNDINSKQAKQRILERKKKRRYLNAVFRERIEIFRAIIIHPKQQRVIFRTAYTVAGI